MNPVLAFSLQFTSTIIFTSLAVWWYLKARLQTHSRRELLLPLVAIHILRTLGLIYLATTALNIAPSLPEQFLYYTAYGDLLAAILATLATFLLLTKQRSSYAAVWLFNLIGFIDLVFAMFNGVRIEFLTHQVGVAWFLPTFVVPALLVTHLAIFYLLLSKRFLK